MPAELECRSADDVVETPDMVAEKIMPPESSRAWSVGLPSVPPIVTGACVPGPKEKTGAPPAGATQIQFPDVVDSVKATCPPLMKALLMPVYVGPLGAHPVAALLEVNCVSTPVLDPTNKPVCGTVVVLASNRISPRLSR